MYSRIFLLVCLGLLLGGCSPAAQTVPPTPTFAPSATPLPTSTVQTTPALQASTETPVIVPSITPAPSSAAPTMDSLLATSVAQLGPMGALTNIAQYYYPTGAPLKTWRDIPIMPEAVSGQEFPPFVYSFTANATLDQARQYYAPLAPKLGISFPPGTGSAGSGAKALHSVTFFSYQLVIVLTSFDQDPKHVIVVISKSP